MPSALPTIIGGAIAALAALAIRHGLRPVRLPCRLCNGRAGDDPMTGDGICPRCGNTGFEPKEPVR